VKYGAVPTLIRPRGIGRAEGAPHELTELATGADGIVGITELVFVQEAGQALRAEGEEDERAMGTGLCLLLDRQHRAHRMTDTDRRRAACRGDALRGIACFETLESAFERELVHPGHPLDPERIAPLDRIGLRALPDPEMVEGEHREALLAIASAKL
jgi:hypothetical protein